MFRGLQSLVLCQQFEFSAYELCVWRFFFPWHKAEFVSLPCWNCPVLGRRSHSPHAAQPRSVESCGCQLLWSQGDLFWDKSNLKGTGVYPYVYMCTRKELCAENSKDTLEWSELSKQTFLMIISSECIKSGEPQQLSTVTLPQILPISSTLSRVTEFISVSLSVVTSILNFSVSSPGLFFSLCTDITLGQNPEIFLTLKKQILLVPMCIHTDSSSVVEMTSLKSGRDSLPQFPSTTDVVLARSVALRKSGWAGDLNPITFPLPGGSLSGHLYLPHHTWFPDFGLKLDNFPPSQHQIPAGTGKGRFERGLGSRILVTASGRQGAGWDVPLGNMPIINHFPGISWVLLESWQKQKKKKVTLRMGREMGGFLVIPINKTFLAASTTQPMLSSPHNLTLLRELWSYHPACLRYQHEDSSLCDSSWLSGGN